MNIFIKTLPGKNYELDVEPDDTIENVKYKLQDKESLPADQRRLIFDGKSLEDSKTVSEYNILEDSVLYSLVKFRPT